MEVTAGQRHVMEFVLSPVTQHVLQSGRVC
jgi:hypothetical protein